MQVMVQLLVGLFANKPFPVETRFLKVSKSILTPIDNILVAGQWTFNPAGVPVSILTAKLAVDAILKNTIKTEVRFIVLLCVP